MAPRQEGLLLRLSLAPTPSLNPELEKELGFTAPLSCRENHYHLGACDVQPLFLRAIKPPFPSLRVLWVSLALSFSR